MRKLFLVLALVLTSCQPSEQAIQTAIARTKVAIPTETNTPGPTYTPFRSDTPVPSNTPLPTATRYPTRTLVPNVKPRRTLLPRLGSLSNPVPLGRQVEVMRGSDINFTIKITKSMRGNDAWNAIYQANRFNQKVKNPQQENLLVYFEVEFVSGSREKALKFGIFDFGSLSDGNDLYSLFELEVPEPQFKYIFNINGGIYVGQKGAGWLDFYVWIDDKQPLVYLGRPGTSNVWYFEVK